MRSPAIAAAMAACIVLLPAAPVLAGQAWQVGGNSYHLYFDDLDLHTATGRAEALTRAEKIAARLCAGDGTRSTERACVTRVLAESTRGSAQAAMQLALDERSAASVTLAQGR